MQQAVVEEVRLPRHSFGHTILADHIDQWRKRPDADVPSWRTAERSCGSVSVRLSYTMVKENDV